VDIRSTGRAKPFTEELIGQVAVPPADSVLVSLDDTHIALLVQLGLTHQGHQEDVETRSRGTVVKAPDGIA
jgi:hypothetical protein